MTMQNIYIYTRGSAIVTSACSGMLRVSTLPKTNIGSESGQIGGLGFMLVWGGIHSACIHKHRSPSQHVWPAKTT